MFTLFCMYNHGLPIPSVFEGGNATAALPMLHQASNHLATRPQATITAAKVAAFSALDQDMSPHFINLFKLGKDKKPNAFLNPNQLFNL